jgi:protein-disulfide isomerase
MSEVTFTLKNPPDKNDHHRGSLDASVVIIEYGDYQCPFCAATAPVLHQIYESSDDVCIIFRHFPLVKSHPNAGIAAIAAEAAAKQKKIWEMHQALFNHQSDLSTENIFTIAQGLELDMREFLNDLEDEDILNKVRNDFDHALANGISETPTIFVNGVLFEGLPSLERLREEISQT